MDITNEIDGFGDVPELHKLPKTTTPTSRAKRGPSNREKVEVYKIDYDRLLSENESLKESNAKLTQIILKNSELEEENGELMAQKQCLAQELSFASNTTDDMDLWTNGKQGKLPELEQQRLARPGHGTDKPDICENCKQELVTEKQSFAAEQSFSSLAFAHDGSSSSKTDEADILKRQLEEEKHEPFAHLFSYFLVLLFALNIAFICLHPDQAIQFMEDGMAITMTKFQEVKHYFLNILQ